MDPYADGPTFSYCSSPDHDYIYSPTFRYQQPACHILSASEVVTKGVDSLSFTTNYIETRDLKYVDPTRNPNAVPFERVCWLPPQTAS